MNNRDSNNNDSFVIDEMEEGEAVCIGGPGRTYANGFAHCGFSLSFVSSIACLGTSGVMLGLSFMMPLEERDKANMRKLGLIIGGVGVSSAIYAGVTFFCCTKKVGQEPAILLTPLNRSTSIL